MVFLGHFYVVFLEEFAMQHGNIQPPHISLITNIRIIYLIRENMQKDVLFKVGTERKEFQHQEV